MVKDWKHQEIAFERFKEAPFFGLLFDCGTGKTRTAIRIAEHKDMPVLVIAPKSLLKQWKDAISEHGEKESEVLIVDAQKRKTKAWKETFWRFLYG